MIRPARNHDRCPPLESLLGGMEPLAQGSPIDARQVIPHIVGVDVRIWVLMGNTETNPGLLLCIRRAKRETVNNDKGTTVPILTHGNLEIRAFSPDLLNRLGNLRGDIRSCHRPPPLQTESPRSPSRGHCPR